MRSWLVLFSFISVVFAVAGCKLAQQQKEASAVAVRTSGQGEDSGVRPVSAPGPMDVTPEPPTTLKELLQSENCRPLSDFGRMPPFWLSGHGFVVTEILARCVTEEGFEGYEVTSDFTSMSIPCTGGGGEVRVKGHYYAPKAVDFIFATDCPVNPPSSEWQAITEIARDALQLEPESRMRAYYPLVVQYWRVVGVADANIGFTLQLKSGEAIQRLWQDFRNGTPVEVVIYGRENAWVAKPSFYEIHAKLVSEGPSTFRLAVDSVQPLSQQDKEQIRMSCESRRSRVSCGNVFH